MALYKIEGFTANRFVLIRMATSPHKVQVLVETQGC